MKHQDIQQQVSYFFQTSSHPHIIQKDFPKEKILTQIISTKISVQQSIEIMAGVLNAIIFLTTNLFTPTQVRPNHIVCANGKWGLQGAVCYRSKKQSSSLDEFTYDPSQLHMHLDQQSELVWCLGKIWLEIISSKKVTANMNQDTIFQTIRERVKNNKKMRDLLTSMLRVDPNNRTTIQEIIKSPVLQQELDLAQVNSSLVKHFSKINNSFRHNKQLNQYKVPFEQQLFYRNFRQQLQIDELLKNVKKIIKNQLKYLDQNNQIQFSCEIIDAQRYFMLKQLEEERQKDSFTLILIEDRKLYSEFTKRMYVLQHQLQKFNKKKKYSTISEKYPQIFIEFDKLKPSQIYAHFKGYIAEFLSKLKSKKQSKSIEMMKNIIKLYIARTSSYVFRSKRKFIFEDFILNSSTVKQILLSIDKSSDLDKLVNLQRKIQHTYFSKK